MDEPTLYVEDPAHKMAGAHLDEDTYSKAISNMIIVCTDAVIFNSERRTIYLAERRVKPMAGWWWIGGRRRAGETATQSMQRCFRRETSLEIPEGRFIQIVVQEYHWKDREQVPQDAGSHNLSYVHAVELSDEELVAASANMDKKEYKSSGLKEFTREQLVKVGAHPAILDFYDKLFGW